MSKISFYLNTNKRGSFHVFVYGNAPELGYGDPEKAVELKKINNSYSHFAEIEVNNSDNDEVFWYSYFFKTRFGAIIHEVCPRRFFTIHHSNICLYDSFDMLSSINSIVIRFRIQYKTIYGQQLFICGDLDELGNWNPENAVSMESTGVDDYWMAQIKIPTSENYIKINYKYIVFTSPKNFFWEPLDNHSFQIEPTPSPSIFEVHDVYQWSDNLLEIYSRDPFVKVINRRTAANQPIKFTSNDEPNTLKINFTVNAPHVHPNQILCITGSTPEIGNWDPLKSYPMNDSEFPLWKATIIFRNCNTMVEYKYVLIEKSTKNIIYEQRYNREIPRHHFKFVDQSYPVSIIVNDWYTNPNTELFRGFGITTSISALRSEKSCGIGQYTDLIPLIDYCKKIGSSLIHLLPINDTAGCEGWRDSNPFNIVSGHALHPIYIDLQDIQGIPSNVIEDIVLRRYEFEQEYTIDYPKIYDFKIKKLKEIFKAVKASLETNNQYQLFVKENQEWLRMYGLFCYFRDKYGTKNYLKWPQYNYVTLREVKHLSIEHSKNLKFYYWVQFVCHSQLMSAKAYAENNSVVLEGEVSLHSPYNSVSVWTNPDLYNIDMATGVVPTRESISSSTYSNHFNKLFIDNSPSFNWKEIASTNYKQWCDRLSRMSKFFHMLQINQSNSIFRFWEVNKSQFVHSLLGHFNPAIPLSRSELKEYGLLDIERYVKPYVRWHLLRSKFGDDAQIISSTFFYGTGASVENKIFSFKPEFSSEKAIHKYCKKNLQSLDEYKRKLWETGLIELLDNVLLVEDPSKSDYYHVRAEVTIEKIIHNSNSVHEEEHIIPSSTWSDLSKAQRDIFVSLFNDFMYNRQNELWKELSAPRLRAIKSASNALLCSDNVDKGNINLTQILYDYNILSNRIQRVPRYFDNPFDKVREYPYLSIATPATALMSSVREWWEENTTVTADFWKREIWRTDEPPYYCEPWILELLLKQHLGSQSMWSVFMLQDLLSIDERYRPINPQEERLSPNSSDPEQKWNYRMRVSLEKLKDADDFCYRIRHLVKDSNRI